MKSGRVGGPEGERGSLAITTTQTARLRSPQQLPPMRMGADPDLGADLLVSPVKGVDQGLLIPRFLYRRADRIYEYAAAMPDAKRRFDELIHA